MLHKIFSQQKLLADTINFAIGQVYHHLGFEVETCCAYCGELSPQINTKDGSRPEVAICTIIEMPTTATVQKHFRVLAPAIARTLSGLLHHRVAVSLCIYLRGGFDSLHTIQYVCDPSGEPFEYIAPNVQPESVR